MLLFLQAAHIVGQVSAAAAAQSRDSNPSYRCLWSGCKVFDRRSCSRSWLEKHVPTHGGRFAFACIVDGCRMRFSSQVRIRIRIGFILGQNHGAFASGKIEMRLFS